MVSIMVRNNLPLAIPRKIAGLKITSAVFGMLLLACAPALAADLMKLNLDDVSTLGLIIAKDAKVKTEGSSSIKFSTLWPTTVCLGEVSGLDVENATLVFSANVKSQLDGSAFLEMWVHVSGGRFFSRGVNSAIQGNSDWITIQTPFILQSGQRPDKITLNLIINGRGTVWIDDVVLSKAPLN